MKSSNVGAFPSLVLRSALALAIGCLAHAATATTTTISVQPPAPTSGQAVALLLYNECDCPSYFWPNIVRNGYTIDVPYGDACLSACLAHTTTYQLGPLPPGTYTVRHFLDGQPSTAEPIGTFVVGEGTTGPAVPALGGGGAIALAMLLALVALLRLRGRGPVQPAE